jgi:hypothetical protein
VFSIVKQFNVDLWRVRTHRRRIALTDKHTSYPSPVTLLGRDLYAMSSSLGIATSMICYAIIVRSITIDVLVAGDVGLVV